MPTVLSSLWIAVAMVVTSCGGVEQKRIRELLVEKGFGTRAQGVATLENYVAGGDAVVFFLEPSQVVQPGLEQLATLLQPQTVGIDGTIHIPYVGRVPILGLTERQLEELVREQLGAIYTTPISLTARIVNSGKAFYVFGESVAKGRVPMSKADLTLFEAIALVGTTRLANLGRVQLIRPDAQNPLVVEVNFREMVLTGLTTYNIALQDNDILYIPPTFFGMITRFIQKLLEPVNVVVQALFGIAQVRSSYDFLIENEGGGLFFGGGRRFFGF